MHDPDWGGNNNQQIQRDTFIFNSFFFTKLREMGQTGQYNFQKQLRIVNKQKVNLRKCRNVVFPINIERSHWLLLNMNLPMSTFYVIDSLLPGTENIVKRCEEEYVSLVRQFMQDYFHHTKSE